MTRIWAGRRVAPGVLNTAGGLNARTRWTMRALMACVAFGTLAALSGCGQKTDSKPASAEGQPAKAATAAAPAAPEPVGWPKRKPGLWTQTMNLKEQAFS